MPALATPVLDLYSKLKGKSAWREKPLALTPSLCVLLMAGTLGSTLSALRSLKISLDDLDFRVYGQWMGQDVGVRASKREIEEGLDVCGNDF